MGICVITSLFLSKIFNKMLKVCRRAAFNKEGL